jgi:hypothetical protein
VSLRSTRNAFFGARVAFQAAQVVEEQQAGLKHEREDVHARRHATFGLRLEPSRWEGDDEVDEECADQGPVGVADGV